MTFATNIALGGIVFVGSLLFCVLKLQKDFRSAILQISCGLIFLTVYLIAGALSFIFYRDFTFFWQRAIAPAVSCAIIVSGLYNLVISRKKRRAEKGDGGNWK